LWPMINRYFLLRWLVGWAERFTASKGVSVDVLA
jgi:hypothetical protein